MRSFNPLNADDCHGVLPVKIGRFQISVAMDAGMNIDISFGAIRIANTTVAAGRTGDKGTLLGVYFTAGIVGPGINHHI